MSEAPSQLAPDDPTLASIQLLDVRQVGKALGLHPGSVWRAVARTQAGDGQGFPEPLRLGAKTIRWRLKDVQRYIDGLSGGRS